MEALIVVDMQNDFIDGALGTKEAEAIVPNVVKKIQEFHEDGEHRILYTKRYTWRKLSGNTGRSESSGCALCQRDKGMGDLSGSGSA